MGNNVCAIHSDIHHLFMYIILDGHQHRTTPLSRKARHFSLVQVGKKNGSFPKIKEAIDMTHISIGDMTLIVMSSI